MKYKQMSIKQYKKHFPDAFKKLPPKLQKDLENDPKYTVRIVDLENSQYIEIGYPTDIWILQ